MDCYSIYTKKYGTRISEIEFEEETAYLSADDLSSHSKNKYSKEIGNSEGGGFKNRGWGLSHGVTFSDFPLNLANKEWHGYSDEAGIVVYNKETLPFYSIGKEVAGFELSWDAISLINFYAKDNFVDVNDYKGESLNVNFSVYYFLMEQEFVMVI